MNSRMIATGASTQELAGKLFALSGICCGDKMRELTLCDQPKVLFSSHHTVACLFSNFPFVHVSMCEFVDLKAEFGESPI